MRIIQKIFKYHKESYKFWKTVLKTVKIGKLAREIENLAKRNDIIIEKLIGKNIKIWESSRRFKNITEEEQSTSIRTII